jgi:transposase
VLNRERNCIERFFNKIKHCRRIATRYEKARIQLPRHAQACCGPPLAQAL